MVLSLPDKFPCVVTSFDGLKWYVECESQFYTTMPCEWWNIEILKDLSKVSRVFIDVGAHCGKYAIRLARYYELVLAIEPHPIHVRVLEKNFKINGIENYIIFIGACGDKHEKRILHDLGGSSTLLNIKSTKTYEVYVTPLDDIIEVTKQANDIPYSKFKNCVVKVDVEGYELNVIKGAKKTIEKNRPIWLIEHHEFRGYKELKGTKEKIKEILKDYIAIDISECHTLYIPCEIDIAENIKVFKKALIAYWVHHTYKMAQEKKCWYYGLPSSWWHGCSQIDFIMVLEKFIEKDANFVGYALKQ